MAIGKATTTTTKRTAIKKPPVYKVAAFLSVVLVCLTAGLSVIDKVLAYSTLTGGLINLIPQALYAWYAFRYRGARSTHLVVRSLFVGEAVKFILTGALFAGVFIILKPLNVLAVFISFLCFQVLSLTGNALLVQRESR